MAVAVTRSEYVTRVTDTPVDDDDDDEGVSESVSVTSLKAPVAALERIVVV